LAYILVVFFVSAVNHFNLQKEAPFRGRGLGFNVFPIAGQATVGTIFIGYTGDSATVGKFDLESSGSGCRRWAIGSWKFIFYHTT